MKKSKKSIARKIGKKILQLIYLLLKPFIPYIIIFVTIFFFIILIIDAIFVSFSDENGELTVSESEIESYCEKTCRANNLLSNISKVLFRDTVSPFFCRILNCVLYRGKLKKSLNNL